MAAMMALTIVGCGGNNTVALQSDKAEETTKADSDATHLVLTTSALDPEVAPDYNPWADGTKVKIRLPILNHLKGFQLCQRCGILSDDSGWGDGF